MTKQEQIANLSRLHKTNKKMEKKVQNKKVIVWDLDNTLYVETDEFKDMLDEATAIALVEDLGLDMDVQTARAIVKESDIAYRDGGEIFIKEYGIDPKALFEAYHKRKPVDVIEPYDGLLARLEKLPYEQYVFTTSSCDAAERILKRIGLYEFFKGKFYSVEDFGVYKKNESSDVYSQFCKKINHNPHDCIFVDDSYSNLEFAKEIGMTTVRIYYNSNSAKDKTYIDSAYKGINAFIDALMLNGEAALH